MFKRDAVTYEYDETLISYILRDDANPLRRICDIIPNHSKVLDIGAGNGLLAVVMKSLNKDVIIDGIEPDSHAAGIALPRYRFFWSGYFQDCKELIQQELYDYIVMADVLEHIDDPQLFLDSLISMIPGKTKIVLSIPNIAFGAVRLDLLKGNFRYVDSGILEKTHLRFFTLDTVLQLMSRSGLAVEKLYFLQRDFFKTDIPHNPADLGWKTLSLLMKDELASTYQFLLLLSRTPTPVQTEEKYYGQKTRISMLDILISMIKKWLKQA